MTDNTTTYADGFGTWHAIVPVQNHESVTRSMARREIKRELRKRASVAQLEDPKFLQGLAVMFVGYAEDGRAEYKEIQPPTGYVKLTDDQVNDLIQTLARHYHESFCDNLGDDAVCGAEGHMQYYTELAELVSKARWAQARDHTKK
jgi:hypothetical protein